MPSSSRVKKHSNTAIESSTFRSEFAGYYPPTDDELRRFVVEGLVVLDTNAVLDLYRFTDTTREEYFDALALLAERLWIPNRVGEEFYDNRTTVIRERQGIRDAITDQLKAPLEILVKAAATQAHRHGLDGPDAEATVREGVLAALEPVIRQIEGTVGDVLLDPDAHPDSDPILAQICVLFAGKTGTAFTDKQLAAAQNDHKIRMVGHIPPGYRDSQKGDRAIGDFLVWKQTITEAAKRKLPVLLVTDEKKEDWVFRDGGYTGPRPELIREMKQMAECHFHLVDVQTFLTLAKKYLAAQVSEAAVDEAARVSNVSAAAAQRETAITAATNKAFRAYDATAGVRDAFASLDATASLRDVMASVDASASLRDVMASVDASASLRDVMASVDASASLRDVIAGIDTTAFIRDIMDRATTGFDLASGTQTAHKALPSSTTRKKAAPAKTAAKRTATKKPATRKTGADSEQPTD